MKVLQIIQNLKKGGAERIALEICVHLNQIKGFSTLILFFEGENEYEELYPDVQTKKVSTNVEISLIRKNKIDVFQLQKAQYLASQRNLIFQKILFDYFFLF